MIPPSRWNIYMITPSRDRDLSENPPKYVIQQCICFPAFNVARYLLLGQLQEIGQFFQQQ